LTSVLTRLQELSGTDDRVAPQNGVDIMTIESY